MARRPSSDYNAWMPIFYRVVTLNYPTQAAIAMTQMVVFLSTYYMNQFPGIAAMYRTKKDIDS
jgi:hypothetical protein